jgi:hypothetical protein
MHNPILCHNRQSASSKKDEGRKKNKTKEKEEKKLPLVSGAPDA